MGEEKCCFNCCGWWWGSQYDAISHTTSFFLFFSPLLFFLLVCSSCVSNLCGCCAVIVFCTLRILISTISAFTVQVLFLLDDVDAFYNLAGLILKLKLSRALRLYINLLECTR